MSSTTTLTETTTTPKSSRNPTLTVIKNGFGAEITGLNFADGVTDDAYHFIRDAITKVRFVYLHLLKSVANIQPTARLCYRQKDKTK